MQNTGDNLHSKIHRYVQFHWLKGQGKKLTESKTISSVQETSPLRETLETIVDGHYGTFTFSYTCDASDHVVCLEVAVSSDPIN